MLNLLDTAFLASASGDTMTPIAKSAFSSFWKMDEPSGNEPDERGVADFSATSVGTTTGFIGDARQIDDAGTMNADVTNSTADFSICFWAKTNDTLQYLIECVGNGGPSRSIKLNFLNSSCQVEVYSGVTQVGAVTANFGSNKSGQWFFCAFGVTLEGGPNWKVWASVSGKAKTENSAINIFGINDITIQPVDFGKSFLIDDMGYILRELTQGEINYLYNRGSGRDL